MTDPVARPNGAMMRQGRVAQKRQTTGAVTRTLAYAYNTQGQMTSVTYPSGAVIIYI